MLRYTKHCGEAGINPAQMEVLGISLTGAFSTSAVHWAVRGHKPSLDRMVETSLIIVSGTLERPKQTQAASKA